MVSTTNEQSHPSSDMEDPERPTWASRALVLILVGLCLVNLVWMVKNCQGMSSSQNGIHSRSSEKGKVAPDFTVLRLEGGAFQLAETKGHPVLIDFWATWCMPCRESLPIVDKVYSKYKDRGLRAIAVETEGQGPGARSFATQFGLNLPIGLGTPELSALYNVSTIPYLVLVNPKGQIHQVFYGVHSVSELSRAIEAAGFSNN